MLIEFNKEDLYHKLNDALEYLESGNKSNAMDIISELIWEIKGR